MIFEEIKPLHHKTDAGHEGLGVDVLEQIRIQAKRRKVNYRVAKSVNDGIGAVITGKADMSSGVETCHKGCEYFGLCGGGNGGNKFWEHGTLASSETNACRFGTQIPVQVLLERFEERPPLTPLTPN